VDPVSWLLDGFGARLGRKLASAPPGQVGVACRFVEPARGRWRNGMLVVAAAGVSFRTRRSTIELDRETLAFDDPRRPSMRDRLRLVEGDRIYGGRTLDGQSVEIAVGGGRATILAALDASTSR
jgi:hypothetical protein